MSEAQKQTIFFLSESYPMASQVQHRVELLLSLLDSVSLSFLSLQFYNFMLCFWLLSSVWAET